MGRGGSRRREGGRRDGVREDRSRERSRGRRGGVREGRSRQREGEGRRELEVGSRSK